MRQLALFGLAALFVAGAAPPAAAVTYYVDNVLGNDRATGLTSQPEAENGPVRTIGVALLLAAKSDRVVLANTGLPYQESISLGGPQHSGFIDKPFVIEGNGAVLDGTVTAAPGAWEHVEDNTFAMRPRRLTYQQVFDAGVPLVRSPIDSRVQLSALEPKQWALFGGRIYFRTEGNSIPAAYDLRHAGLQTGITLYDVRNVRIENVVVQGFQQDGINAHELVRNCQLVAVECRANGRAGLSVGGASRVTVDRGNFYDNGRVQVRTEGLAELEMFACDVGDTAAPAYHTGGRSLIVDGELVKSN